MMTPCALLRAVPRRWRLPVQSLLWNCVLSLVVTFLTLYTRHAHTRTSELIFAFGTLMAMTPILYLTIKLQRHTSKVFRRLDKKMGIRG